MRIQSVVRGNQTRLDSAHVVVELLDWSGGSCRKKRLKTQR